MNQYTGKTPAGNMSFIAAAHPEWRSRAAGVFNLPEEGRAREQIPVSFVHSPDYRQEYSHEEKLL